MTKSLALLSTTCLLICASCARFESVASTAPSAASPTAQQSRFLSTELVESGDLPLSAATPAQLEAFLQDLNQRKDTDYAVSGNQPGPDAPFLSGWVDRVTAELLSRGYYFDSQSNLRRPGEVVAVR